MNLIPVALMICACGADEHRPRDAATIDARADASLPDSVTIDAAYLTCGGGDPPCPADLRYCCLIALESPRLCTSEFTDGTCQEQPIGGTMTTCDPSTGSGCSGAQQICCGDGSTTYCTDHPYLGDLWTCSGLPDAATTDAS